MLVSQARLGDKMLDGLMEAVVVAHDEASLHECLACLAVMAAERTTAQVPDKVQRTLLKIPQLCAKLRDISHQCDTERLALACALGAILGVARSDQHRAVLNDILDFGLLSEPKVLLVLSALLELLTKSEPGSAEHAELLAITVRMTESKSLLSVLYAAAKQSNFDMGLLGMTATQSSETGEVADVDSEDEDMLDIEEDSSTDEANRVEVPVISVTSFFHAKAHGEFTMVADAFERAVAVKQTKHFLENMALGAGDATQKPQYLSFLARVWSSSRPIPVRLAALKATKTAIERIQDASVVQTLLPYLVHALSNPSPLVRRSAAGCIGALPGMSSTNSKAKLWGCADLYGSTPKNVTDLNGDDVSILLSKILQPILEECVMDPNFIIPAVRASLEDSQTSKSHHPKHAFKTPVRTALLSFFAIHASLTPVLSVRLSLLPMFSFLGKVSHSVRSTTILPLIQRWCSLPISEVSIACEAQKSTLEDADRAHLAVLLPKDTKSVQVLQDIISGNLNQDRLTLADATFDQIKASWSKLKSEDRLMLAQSLLGLSFSESNHPFHVLCRERSQELLRGIKLDSEILVTLLESVPFSVQMIDGPPAKKRRRTSRNEMARSELSSQEEVQGLLRKLVLVLELIEGSNPGQHPALFRSLFTVFGELQTLKQQTGSELVYLQSMILASLTPIVDTLKVSSSIKYNGW